MGIKKLKMYFLREGSVEGGGVNVSILLTFADEHPAR